MKALSFKEQIAADNAAVFLNEMEFAELHDLNGTECKAGYLRGAVAFCPSR